MEEKRDILKDFTEKMEVLFGRSLNKIILYGSYARGDYKENSDIDIMILTSMSEDEIRIIENQVYDIAYDYQLSDNIQVDTAKSLVENSLHTFDDAMGQSKEDGAAWSQLLNKANGRLQYDLEIIVKSNGESDFPLFGTKHAGVDAITYTGQNVKDQASADKAIQRQAEVDAANKAAANNNQ